MSLYPTERIRKGFHIKIKWNKFVVLLVVLVVVLVVVGIWGLLNHLTEMTVQLTVYTVIYDNQTPVEGVNLFIEDPAGKAVEHKKSNSKGEVQFRLKPGNYHIYALQGFTGGMNLTLTQDQAITLRVSYVIQ
jgi:hypothetical protein